MEEAQIVNGEHQRAAIPDGRGILHVQASTRSRDAARPSALPRRATPRGLSHANGPGAAARGRAVEAMLRIRREEREVILSARREQGRDQVSAVGGVPLALPLGAVRIDPDVHARDLRRGQNARGTERPRSCGPRSRCGATRGGEHRRDGVEVVEAAVTPMPR